MTEKSGLNWVELILGILFVVMGAYTLINPEVAFNSFLVAYGIIAIVTGIADIFLYATIKKHTGHAPSLSAITGILSILSGIAVIFATTLATWVILFIIAIWFVSHCIGRLLSLGFVKSISGNRAFIFSLIINIFGLILGIILIFNPLYLAIFIGYILSVYLLVVGFSSVVYAFS